MLSVNALDFLNYKNALKGNYRKGVHVFRCILENPTQAADFAANLGGVSVVLGVPLEAPDRNSQQLLSLLLNSAVIDAASLTWVSQWYSDYSDDWDTLASDLQRSTELAGSEFLWRAVGYGPVGSGKVIATLAGLNCREFARFDVVAANAAAMTAVAAAPAAMAAVIASPTALNAVAASQTAMAAIWSNETALQAVKNNAAAWATFTGASSAVMGKTAAILAGLDPDDYADMEAVAASSTAMAAVAASQTAMAAVAASQTAMAAIRASTTAMAALAGSTVAYNSLLSSPLIVRYNPVNDNAWRTDTVYNGSGIFVRLVSYNASSNWYKLDGGGSVTLAAKDSKVLKPFNKSLQVYWVSYSVATRGVYYIPC